MICPIAQWKERFPLADLEQFARCRRIYAASLRDEVWRLDKGDLLCVTIKLIAKLESDAEGFTGRARAFIQGNQGRSNPEQRAASKEARRRTKRAKAAFAMEMEAE